jgi:hypothetical protein
LNPDHVLDVLPAAEQPAPVADLGVAGHRADTRIGEKRGQRADGVRFHHGVAVDHHHELGARRGQTGVQRRRLPGVALPDQPNLLQAKRLDELRGAVGRAVVDPAVREARRTSRARPARAGC